MTQQTIDELKRENEQLKAELEQARADIEGANEEIHHLQIDHDACFEQAEKYRAMLDKLVDACRGTRTKLEVYAELVEARALLAEEES